MMLHFVHRPPADEAEDGEIVLLDDGLETGIAIQDCRDYAGEYSVNRYKGEGATFSMTVIGSRRHLLQAKLLAMDTYARERIKTEG